MRLLLLLLACGEPKAPATCNGAAALCDRPLNEITVAATHNAMSNAEEGWLGPNQGWSLRHQLDAGVRGLNLDVYDVDGEATLCHGYCSLGAQPLIEALGEINDFLDETPDAVLLITLESYAGAELVKTTFDDSGLGDRAIPHPEGADWPTLKTLLANDARVGVWTSDGGGTTGWYLDQWTDWMDNPYHVERGEEFPCTVDRGAAENPFTNLNHFITDPIASADDAATANTAAVLQEHIERCTAAWGRPPNQVLVDFIDIGDTLAVVDALNQR